MAALTLNYGGILASRAQGKQTGQVERQTQAGEHHHRGTGAMQPRLLSGGTALSNSSRMIRPLAELEMYPPIPISLSTLLCTQAKFSTELHDPKGGLYTKTMQHVCELTFENGDSYKGEVEDGYMHGHGEYCFGDGTTYVGGFRYNLPSGKGKLIVPSSAQNRFYTEYNGQFLNGVRSGLGILKIPQEGYEYTGEFSLGIMQGKAKILYHNGSAYDGEVYKGKRHGYGRLTYKSGNYYEGNWSDGVKQGSGKMVWLDSHEEYSGEWKDNKCHGWGTLYYYQQNRRIALLTNRFVGSFSMGARNGIGTFFYADGSKYEGEWFDNQKHGYAVHTLEDGTIKEGYYEKDRLVVTFRNSLDYSDSLLYNPATVPNLSDDLVWGLKSQQIKNPNSSKDMQFQSNGKPYSLVGYPAFNPNGDESNRNSANPTPKFNQVKSAFADMKDSKKQIVVPNSGSSMINEPSITQQNKAQSNNLSKNNAEKVDAPRKVTEKIEQVKPKADNTPGESQHKSTRLIVAKDQTVNLQPSGASAKNFVSSSVVTLPVSNNASKNNLNSQNSLALIPKAPQVPTSPPGPTVVQQNIYLSLINIDDILITHTEEEQLTASLVVIETLLRLHSTLKSIYQHLLQCEAGSNLTGNTSAVNPSHLQASTLIQQGAAGDAGRSRLGGVSTISSTVPPGVTYKQLKEEEETERRKRVGSVLTRNFWLEFLKQYRLETASAGAIDLDKSMAQGKKNRFDLKGHHEEVQAKIAELKKNFTPQGEPKVNPLAASINQHGQDFSNRSTNRKGLGRIESFDQENERSFEDQQQREEQIKEWELQTKSLSLDLEVVDLFKDPQQYPEVSSEDNQV